jgi:peptidoglycan glycosyltransferase
MKPETADLVRGMMITVVEKGSGQPARVQGLTVGGKTGTAQVGGGLAPHAWFIGFRAGGRPQRGHCCHARKRGEGHDVAAPIFAAPGRYRHAPPG